MEATECGAAALAMVLATHGRWITLEEARERCATSRDGVNAAGIVAAAQSYGLDATAFRREPEELCELPMPQVLHWCFDHFVVLESAQSGRYVVLDPAQGRITYDRAAFGERFTGITIAFAKTPAFEKGGRPPSIAGALAREASRSKDALAVAFLTGVLAVIPGLALAGAMAALVNHVLGARQTDWIPALIAILLAITLAQGAIAWLSAWTVATWKIKIGAISALASFAHALKLPLAYYAQRSAGEVVARIRIGSELGGTIAGPLAQLLPQIVLVACFLAVIGFYDTTIMAAAIVTAGINFLALAFVVRRLSDRTREHQLAEGRAAAVATSGMDNYSAYALLGREQLLLARWSATEDAAIATEQRLGLLRVVAQLGPIASGLVLNAVVLIACGARAMDGAMTLGDLVALQVLATLLAKPIASLANGFCAIQESAGALMRLADLERHRPIAGFDARHRDDSSADVDGRLTLCGVSLSHSHGRPLFSNVNLDFAPGTMVAIVGKTGAGKSTLARVAGGMLDPTAGSVKLDGRDLADWPADTLRGALAYVGQHAATFSGTIAENITLFDKSIPMVDIVEAADRAGLASAISGRTGGLETKIVAGATGLSGGERQRLALARALLRRPRVLILDETTSALDPASEERVMAELRASGATVLIVTHRPGTARRCDEAILVGEGGLITRGEPAVLMPSRSVEPVSDPTPEMPLAGAA